MDHKEGLLVQRIYHEKSQDTLDLSWLVEAVYIETTDLSGPRLILRINDRESLFRDDLKLAPLDALIVTLADPYQRDGLNLEERFIIQTMPVDNQETITLNCLPEVIHALKQPASSARFFVNSSVISLVRAFMPVPVIGNVFSSSREFHLLPAMRPSRLLRQAAREAGAMLFYRRGEVVCRQVSELAWAEPAFEYHFNDERQENQIATYTQISAATMVDDRIQRHYQGWSLTGGRIAATVLPTAAVELSGLDTVPALDCLSTAVSPVLDMLCLGNGGLRAGDTLSLIWNRSNIECPIDESLPEKVIIGTVAHSFSGNNYRCRIKALQERPR